VTVGDVLLSAVWLFLIILVLFIISSFAGLLPVVSWVLALNSLIINGIHFCRLCVLLGVVLTVGSYFSFYFKKEKENFCQSLR
jgi:hypothetical protein